jgi:hypothetical protein
VHQDALLEVQASEKRSEKTSAAHRDNITPSS